MSGRKATGADRVEALCFAGLAAALISITATGRYTNYATPRTLPYLIVSSVMLSVLAIIAWLGLFQATARSCRRLLVALAIPALLVAIPLQSASSSGFDQYAGGRAIAINYHDGEQTLHGLDKDTKTITIADDEFGSWFDLIDHNPQQYLGYTVVVTGFVSRPSTLGSGQFEISRQLMSCCILDMTPFGFTAQYAKAAQLGEHTWVRIRGTLQSGSIGKQGYSYEGLMLKVSSIDTKAEAPTGYFYRA